MEKKKGEIYYIITECSIQTVKLMDVKKYDKQSVYTVKAINGLRIITANVYTKEELLSLIDKLTTSKSYFV